MNTCITSRCAQWDSANECCNLAETLEYDSETFYILCPCVAWSSEGADE